MSIQEERSKEGKKGIFDGVHELIARVEGGTVGVLGRSRGSSGARECVMGR